MEEKQKAPRRLSEAGRWVNAIVRRAGLTIPVKLPQYARTKHRPATTVEAGTVAAMALRNRVKCIQVKTFSNNYELEWRSVSILPPLIF